MRSKLNFDLEFARLIAPNPANGLTCLRNSPVSMGSFSSQRHHVGEQASPGLSVFLGNGVKVLQLVSAEDANGRLPCCLIAFLIG